MLRPHAQLDSSIKVDAISLSSNLPITTPAKTMAHRTEIDGLRAVAVLPVLIVHAGFSWFPGGFLGVDIFFVISGYLIANILRREIMAGKLSLLQSTSDAPAAFFQHSSSCFSQLRSRRRL